MEDPPTETYVGNPEATGSMAVPFEVRVDPIMGRCLHATAPIKKGDLLWRVSNVRILEHFMWHIRSCEQLGLSAATFFAPGPKITSMSMLALYQ